MPKFPSALVLTLSAGFALLVLQACPNPLAVPPPGDSKPLPPPEEGPLFKDTRGRTLTSVLRNKPTLIDPDGSKTTVTLNIRGETVFSSLEIPPGFFVN